MPAVLPCSFRGWGEQPLIRGTPVADATTMLVVSTLPLPKVGVVIPAWLSEGGCRLHLPCDPHLWLMLCLRLLLWRRNIQKGNEKS